MITSTYLIIPDDEKPRSNSGRTGITPRFGVQGNWNNQTGAQFQQALENVVNGPNTQAYSIEFRGQPGYTAYVDLPTGNAVIVDANDNFAASWSLSANQLEGVIVNGKLW